MGHFITNTHHDKVECKVCRLPTLITSCIIK